MSVFYLFSCDRGNLIHHPGKLFSLSPSRLDGKLLKGIRDAKHVPGYFHGDIVEGLAAINPCLQFLHNLLGAALVETVGILAGANPEVRKRIHAGSLE